MQHATQKNEWATKREIRKHFTLKPLDDREEPFIGRIGSKIISVPGNTPVNNYFISGPAGTGKTRNIIMPYISQVATSVNRVIVFFHSGEEKNLQRLIRYLNSKIPGKYKQIMEDLGSDILARISISSFNVQYLSDISQTLKSKGYKTWVDTGESLLVFENDEEYSSTFAPWLSANGYDVKCFDWSQAEDCLYWNTNIRNIPWKLRTQKCAFFFKGFSKMMSTPLFYSRIFFILLGISADQQSPDLFSVNIIFDNFSQCSDIPRFKEFLRSIKNTQIKILISNQSFATLEQHYPTDWCEIVDSCPIRIFMSGTTETRAFNYFGYAVCQGVSPCNASAYDLATLPWNEEIIFGPDTRPIKAQQLMSESPERDMLPFIKKFLDFIERFLKKHGITITKD